MVSPVGLVLEASIENGGSQAVSTWGVRVLSERREKCPSPSSATLQPLCLTLDSLFTPVWVQLCPPPSKFNVGVLTPITSDCDFI